MTIRCEICNRKVPPERKTPGVPCYCRKCAGMTNTVSTSGILARAQDMEFSVVWSNVNQAYIVVDERYSKLVGIKNTIEEVRNFLDDMEDDRAPQTT